MSNFEGKSWRNIDGRIEVYEGNYVGPLVEPVETYVQTDAGWVDGSGDVVGVEVQDDLDALVTPVDQAQV